MREVAVIGVGMHPFGKHTDKTYREIGAEACRKAIEDANIDPKEIQISYYGTSSGLGAGYEALREIGITGIPITRVENACSGGSCAFREAYLAIASGLYDIALPLGIEKMRGLSMVEVGGGLTKWKADMQARKDIAGGIALSGMVNLPGHFALIARRHMYEFGTTREQIAQVSVKNHRNGAMNPYAQYQKETPLDEVLNSRMISDPLTILQCCPYTDGAAAAVLTSKEIAKKYTDTPIYVAGSAQASGGDEIGSLTTNEITVRCSREAYKRAKIKPKDIDVAEVHDCFSIAEILHYEDMGFCKKGEGGKVVEEGVTEIDGKIPVNPGGGLLSRGHPLGATGLAQVAEIVWQLRGEAGKRQVEGAEIALTHTMGWPGNGVVEVVNILRT